MTAPTLPTTPEVELVPPFDVVALVASAGGLDAVSTVLRGLPSDLLAAVLVVLHLGGGTSALVEILGRRSALPVAWADDGAPLAPGRVLVCPPRKRLEALPDGTCALHEHLRGARDYPLDACLGSLADSFGRRALAVVLTGMGRDGAAGARALKQAGGVVLVQSEDTAEQPAMPRAAVAAGAADLVLPLHEIGPTLAELVAGGRLPRPPAEREAAERLFAGLGEAMGLLRAFDWPRSPLGPVSAWPASLRTAARLVLDSPVATCLLWGPEQVLIYNDLYRGLMGAKHPAGLAQPNRACWPEVWLLNEHLYARVCGGEPIAVKDALYPITRHGALEDAWFDMSFAPARDESGAVGGIVATVFETTSRVLAARRLGTLHALSSRAAGATSPREALGRAFEALAGNVHDVPFALAYLLDEARAYAHLAGAVGLDEGGPLAPRTLRLEGGHPVWPVAKVVADGAPVTLGDLSGRGHGAGATPDPDGPTAALLLPLRLGGDERPAGVLALGLGPRLPFDAAYREFFDLVAAQVSASLTEARARQKERERRERLAELDRAKIEFFSNVSHEFRTPLTLLLGPLDELARRRAELPQGLAGDVETAARNARRLLNLVNTLLDVSQIEAGRLRAHFEPVDLAALTGGIASLFQSAAERAGLALRVDCPPLPEPVWVDPVMWEKVVSNLLSNALKFTFEGEVVVELRALRQHVELVVRDTGVGIPEAELPNLFKRFHRVRGAKARTHEGSGIGLALAHELVRQHQGRIRVQSKEGAGTTFTVWLSRGRRLGLDEPATTPTPAPPTAALALATEAARWSERGTGAAATPVDGASDLLGPPANPLQARASGARLLVVDDNADMRAYLTRLLAPHWQVESVADGEEALAAMRVRPPDLVVADVMMPNLDGFGLVRAIRGDEALKAKPVLLLTARAGEEAAIEGLLAGADDYLAKPFSARELVARVGAQLELARVRRRAAELNAFLVRFSDAVRGLTDPVEVARTACRMVLEQLGVDRAYWSEIDWPTSEWVAIGEAHRPGVSALTGRFALDAWQPGASRLLEGCSSVVDDSRTDPNLPASVKDACTRLQIGANVAIPVLVYGKLRGVLAVDQCHPRRWSPEEVVLVESVASRCWAEVERARVEATVRAAAARDAYRVALTDALRSVDDAVEAQAVATHLLGDHLGASRVMYGEANGASTESFTNHREYRRDPAMPTSLGEHRWDDFGAYVAAEMRTGRTLVVDDVHTHPAHSAGDLAAYEAVGIRAYAAVPLVREGRIVAYLAVNHTTPHPWTAAEVALVEETAERMWSAVERARAEAALRVSEEKHRSLFETMGQGYCDLELVRDADGRAVDQRYLTLNPAFEQLFGISVAQAQGRRASEVFPGLDPWWTESLNRIARTGTPERLEHEETVLGRWYEVQAYPRGGDRLTVLYEDVTERARAGAALRANEARQAFLLKLSDALRPLADPAAIQGEAARLLLEHFAVGWCYYAEFDEAGEAAIVLKDASREGLPSLAGRHDVSDLPEYVDFLRTGKLLDVPDFAGYELLTPRVVERYTALGLRSLLGVALVKEGRLLSQLLMADTVPRQWPREAAEWLGEVAERTWAALDRARADAAAARADRRAKAVIERMGDAYCVLDRDFRIVSANAATERLLGVPRAALLGRSHWDVFPASAEAPVGRAFRRVVAEGVEQHLTHHYAGEGHDLHLELDAYPTEEGGVAMFWRDVTERVRAEQALRANEEKYRALFTEMDEAYAVVEVVADTTGRWTDFLFLEVNPAFMRHTGMPYPVGRLATQLLGTPNPRWAELYGRAAQTGESIRLEEEEPTLGRVFDLNIFRLGGEGTRRVAVLFADITARKRTEAALKASEERLRALAKAPPSAPDGMSLERPPTTESDGPQGQAASLPERPVETKRPKAPRVSSRDQRRKQRPRSG